MARVSRPLFLLLALLGALPAGCVGPDHDGVVLAHNASDAPVDLVVRVEQVEGDGERREIAREQTRLGPGASVDLGDLFDGPGSFVIFFEAGGDRTNSAAYDSEEGRLPPYLVGCVGTRALDIVASLDRAPLRRMEQDDYPPHERPPCLEG